MLGRAWLFNDGKLRAGWRIVLYLALFLLLSLAGRFTASLTPRDPLGWVGLAVGVAAALVPGWLLLIRLDGRAPGALGFAFSRVAPREVLAGIGVGGALIGFASGLLIVTGAAHFVPDSGTPIGYVLSLAWTLLYFGLAAAYEEAVFRGYAFQALVEGLGAAPAVVVSSALFAAAHAANPHVDAVAFANIFLAGILLALAYLRTRSLWFATAVHAGWNWTMASLFAFPVSGLTMIDTPLYDIVESGRAWWTGAAFGPEAGLAGSFALVVGVIWLARTRALGEAPRMRRLRPLVDSRLPVEGA
ncbi:MAG TPA: CPBP family intramembrane glutamic endopeptidase [Longimicrobiaceae bacterium]|nr:CPBP family intramembrane glutamic endopeptidase [Longimicrobiaceae bacterium]